MYHPGHASLCRNHQNCKERLSVNKLCSSPSPELKPNPQTPTLPQPQIELYTNHNTKCKHGASLTVSKVLTHNVPLRG